MFLPDIDKWEHAILSNPRVQKDPEAEGKRIASLMYDNVARQKRNTEFYLRQFMPEFFKKYLMLWFFHSPLLARNTVQRPPETVKRFARFFMNGHLKLLELKVAHLLLELNLAADNPLVVDAVQELKIESGRMNEDHWMDLLDKCSCFGPESWKEWECMRPVLL